MRQANTDINTGNTMRSPRCRAVITASPITSLSKASCSTPSATVDMPIECLFVQHDHDAWAVPGRFHHSGNELQQSLRPERGHPMVHAPGRQHAHDDRRESPVEHVRFSPARLPTVGTGRCRRPNSRTSSDQQYTYQPIASHLRNLFTPELCNADILCKPIGAISNIQSFFAGGGQLTDAQSNYGWFDQLINSTLPGSADHCEPSTARSPICLPVICRRRWV